MAYEVTRPEHHLVLEQRERLVISGVEEVARFDEETIVLTTTMGELEIQGEDLHIEKLSLEGGELHVDGRIDSIAYEEPMHNRGSLLRRLFG